MLSAHNTHFRIMFLIADFAGYLKNPETWTNSESPVQDTWLNRLQTYGPS